MNRRTAFLSTLVRTAVSAAFALTAAAGAAAASTAATAGTQPSDIVDACGPAAPGHARCLAEIRTDVHGGLGVRPAAAAALGAGTATTPTGMSPAQLQSAYKLPDTGGADQTVALVDAGDDPNAEADLAVYRATYGLPACTTADGCFQKINGQGAAGPLPPDAGWGVEISLDLDMVSAACPGCHILLVEADSAALGDLAAAENTAVAAGATEISNSYGGQEYGGDLGFQADYSHPGVAIVASTGDEGFGIPNFPAVLPTVIAAGGTTLTAAPNTARGWTETAWSGSGSGCSAWFAKPAWQKDKHCPGRTVADISADADPDTGPAVYDSTDLGGWGQVGGTSAASPFLAAVIALAGNPGSYPNASYFYSHASDLFDVVGGDNALQQTCGTDYLCNAVKGYDGPTGLGTPDGTAAF